MLARAGDAWNASERSKSGYGLELLLDPVANDPEGDIVVSMSTPHPTLHSVRKPFGQRQSAWPRRVSSDGSQPFLRPT